MIRLALFLGSAIVVARLIQTSLHKYFKISFLIQLCNSPFTFTFTLHFHLLTLFPLSHFIFTCSLHFHLLASTSLAHFTLKISFCSLPVSPQSGSIRGKPIEVRQIIFAGIHFIVQYLLLRWIFPNSNRSIPDFIHTLIFYSLFFRRRNWSRDLRNCWTIPTSPQRSWPLCSTMILTR